MHKAVIKQIADGKDFSQVPHSPIDVHWHSSKTMANQITWCHIPEDNTLFSHHCEDLKSNKMKQLRIKINMKSSLCKISLEKKNKLFNVYVHQYKFFYSILFSSYMQLLCIHEFNKMTCVLITLSNIFDWECKTYPAWLSWL
jgi:hypothetical protein